MNTPFTVNEIIFPKESYEKIKDLIHKIGIVVFNTLSRSKEQLKTLQENKLLLYTC
jgi:hypothetical protein